MMIDKRTFLSGGIGLVSYKVVNGVDWTNPTFLNLAIFGFYVTLAGMMFCYLQVKRSIGNEKNNTKLTLRGEGYTEVTTIQAYDWRHVKQNMVIYLVATAGVFVMFIGFNVVPALVMHSVFSLSLLFQDPVFQIHIFKRKAVGNLARPFGSAPVFPENSKSRAITSKEALNTELSKAGKKVVVVEFYTEWCKSCRQIAPEIEEIADKNRGVVFLHVNAEEVMTLATDYGVKKVPHFVFIRNKEKVDEFVGGTKTKIENALVNLNS